MVARYIRYPFEAPRRTLHGLLSNDSIPVTMNTMNEITKPFLLLVKGTNWFQHFPQYYKTPVAILTPISQDHVCGETRPGPHPRRTNIHFYHTSRYYPNRECPFPDVGSPSEDIEAP